MVEPVSAITFAPSTCAPATPAPVTSCCTVHDGALAALTTMLYGVLCNAQSKLGDPRNYPVDINPGSKYDYIIVGAGTAGSVLASRLSENRTSRVLLMDLGEDPSESSEVPNLQYSSSLSCDSKIYTVEPNYQSCLAAKNGQCTIRGGKGLGGSSVIGQNLFIHCNPEDYNYWAQVTGDPKWNYANVLPVIKRTENSSYDNDEYHGKGGYLNIEKYDHTNDDIAHKIEQSFNCVDLKTKDLNAGDQIGFMIADVLQSNGMKGNSAKAYLKPARGRDNLYVSKNTLVTKLIYDKICRRIIGVEYYKNGVSKLVYANNEVIVANGAIRTAQLLLVSGIGPQEDIKQLGVELIKDVPEVGKNLQFHAQTIGLCFALTKLPDSNTSDQLTATFEYLVKQKGILSGYSYEDLIAFLNINDMNSKYPNIQINPHVEPKNSIILNSLLDAYALTDENKQIYLDLNKEHALLFFSIQLLRSDCVGYMKVKSTNVRDNAIIYQNTLCNNEDVNNILETIKFCMKLSKSKPMKKLGATLVGRVPACGGYSDCDDYWRCAIRHMTSIVQPVGTCGMGKVVDGDLKVIDINGLRLSGGAVIPRSTAGVFYIPTVVTAEVLAQTLDESLMGIMPISPMN